ncbi:MAG: hypothetical protein PVG14_07320 [Anaerolineales bacterium]|jgi:hypothetical protein
MLADMPMADLTVIAGENYDERRLISWLIKRNLQLCGVTENENLCGVYVLRRLESAIGIADF